MFFSQRLLRTLSFPRNQKIGTRVKGVYYNGDIYLVLFHHRYRDCLPLVNGHRLLNEQPFCHTLENFYPIYAGWIVGILLKYISTTQAGIRWRAKMKMVKLTVRVLESCIQ